MAHEEIDEIRLALEPRFDLGEVVGEGGMAIVYRSRDNVHDRLVAIKILRSEYAGAVNADRFAREIRLAGSVDHSCVLPILDSGHACGLPYYVMPFMPAGSLRDRLREERQLPLEEAFRIARDIADVLTVAHQEGILHRDIKPGNLFIEGDRILVADFGIARALEDAGKEKLTRTGVALGTAGYISPEQASGQSTIDARSDLYSLGCVLFELLAGEPPYTGHSSQVIIARQLSQPVPSVRAIRETVPEEVDHVLRKALAKSPADRYASCEAFAEALERAAAAAPSGKTRAGRRGFGRRRASDLRSLSVPGSKRVRYGLGVLVLAVAVAVAVSVDSWPFFAPQTVPDTTRYAVLPPQQEVSLAASVPIGTLVEDALGRWDGITVVDPLVIEGIVAQASSSGDLTLDVLREVGTAADAGRLVTLHPTVVGDSVRVEARLIDPFSSFEPLERTVFMVAPGGPAEGDVVAGAVESLLFGVANATDGPLVHHTSSVAAARRFLLAQEARLGWSLPEAEGHLADAAALDPFFDLALFWKAQVMSWQGRPTQEWEIDARRAVQSAEALGPRERRLSAALVAMADGRYPEACAIYQEMRDEEPDDFAALFGLGECRRRDPMVVPDAGSRTGWSFRASAHAAATAYRTAFERLPSAFRSFGPRSPAGVRDFLYVRRGEYNTGMSAPPEGRIFNGHREWRGDSLARVAVPRDSVALFRSDLEAQEEAWTHQRRALLDVANAWADAFPTSSGALHTLALARELVGDESAIDAYHQARELAQEPWIRAEIGIAEVMLRVRLSIPGDSLGLQAAVALGDSLLATAGVDPRQDRQWLARQAVLLGRPSLAAQMARAAVRESGLGGMYPAEVAREAEALLAFASVGAPADSIRALEERIGRLIEQSVPTAEIQRAQRAVLEQPSFLAFPHDILRYVDIPGLPAGSYARAIAALESGDAEGAIRILGDPLPEVGWDVLLTRANILVAAGRDDDALALLRTALGNLAVADPAALSSMPRVGGLVRAVALRAELEEASGSIEEAVRWARAIEILWGTGEDAVSGVLHRMRSILRSQNQP